MFKSIDYKLRFCLLALILTALAIPLLLIYHYFIAAGFSLLLLLVLIYQLHQLYNKLTKNVVFLFQAIENGDYSFKFQEDSGSLRERELHRAMNHIKEILAQTKKDIVEQERFFSIVIEQVSTGILILDAKQQIQTVNQAAKQLLGLPILTHLNQLQHIQPELPQLLRDLEPKQAPTQITLTTERGDLQLSLKANRIRLQRGSIKIIIINNINSELDTKEMDSWMNLIRVMTHEIMNSIAPISSLADSLLLQIKSSNTAHKQEDELLQEGLETIYSTTKELLQFVQTYRQFTRIPAPQPSSFDLTALLKHAIQLTRENPLAQAVAFDLAQTSPTNLVADRSHVLQVLLNLLKNAVEATAGTAHPQVTIRLEQSEHYQVVHIQNYGPPIPPEVVSQIFIPFFTTKEQGSGIGLSISRYMMRMHGGAISLQSKGEETTFSLYFPRS